MHLNLIKSTYKTLFGHHPQNTFFAPGRINLIGEHIDYNGGLVFPAPITLGTYAAVSKRSDLLVSVYSINFKDNALITFSLDALEYDKSHGWANYVKGVIKYIKEEGYSLPHGLNIVFYGDIPNGAGLSSSASLEILTTTILNEVYLLGLTPIQTALIGQKVENLYMGLNSGIMDQCAIALGKKEHALLLNCQTLDYDYFPIALKDHSIVIMNTNKRRELADSKYNERRSECESALAKLNTKLNAPNLCALSLDDLESNKALLSETEYRRARHVISENQRVKQAAHCLETGDLTTFGKLLNASHASLCMDYEVTGIELDTLVSAALDTPGTIGARMTGAGFGGCSLAIVENDATEHFIKEVGEKYLDAIGYSASFYIASIGNGPTKLS